MDNFQQTKKCPSCGAEVSQDSAYCPFCNAQLSYQTAPMTYAANGMTNSEFSSGSLSGDVVAKKSHKKMIAILSAAVVLIAAAVIVIMMVLNSAKTSPVKDIINAANKTAKEESASFEAKISEGSNAVTLSGVYEVDVDKDELVMDFSIKENYQNSEADNNSNRMIIYCKDGLKKFYIKSGEYSMVQDIPDESFEEMMNQLKCSNKIDTDTFEADWDEYVKNKGLEDKVNADEIASALKDFVDELSKEDVAKEVLGLEQEKTKGGTKYSFDIDSEAFAELAPEKFENIFADEDSYKEAKENLKDDTSEDNMKFDVTVSDDGYLTGFSTKIEGGKISYSMDDIGTAKADIEDDVLEEIKNAKTTSPYDVITNQLDEF